MKKVALFAGSFDPFTRGHEAVVEEALRIFDEVVVGVGENVAKKGLLSVEQRCRLIEELYAENERVRVAKYSTLTGDFAREVGATALVRGVRNTVDFEFERTIEATNSICTYRRVRCASCSPLVARLMSCYRRVSILRTI